MLLLLFGVWVSSERAAVCNRVVVKNEEVVDCVVVNALQLELEIADRPIAAMAAADAAGNERRGFILDLSVAYYELIGLVVSLLTP